jgi:hypothetical protein
MLRDFSLMRRSDRGSVAMVLSLALLTAACSSGGIGAPAATATDPAAAPAPGTPPSSAPSLKDKVTGFFEGSSARSPQTVSGTQQLLDCPFIDIRQGASTLFIGARGSSDETSDSDNNGAMALRYQGSFVRAARECADVAGNMVMKVGIEGRIIVGPAGGPGQVDVPLRIAVVRETVAGAQPIVTRFAIIPVTVASQTDNPTFTHIEDGLTFPMPPGHDLDSYVVYIGFDPQSAHAPEKPKPKSKANAKAKPKARPSPASPTG